MRLTCLLLLAAVNLQAACDQDLSFGSSGALTYGDPAGGSQSRGQDLLVLSDGRLLVAGGGTRSGGDLDACWWSLDSGGVQGGSGSFNSLAGGTDEEFFSAAQASSGGPVYLAGPAVSSSGATVTAIVRLSFPALSIDNSFGSAGIVTRTGGTEFPGLAVDSSGRVYVAEGSQVTRFLSSGAPDPSFGSGGSFTFDAAGNAQALALDSQGRLVIAGGVSSGLGVWRALTSAALDSSFGSGGKVTRSTGALLSGWQALALGSDDSIAVTGMIFSPPSSSRWAFGRYSASGSSLAFVQGSGVSNIVVQETGKGVLLNGDGSALVMGASPSGFNPDPSLWRLDNSGALDASFGSGGQRILSATTGFMGKARRSGSAAGLATGGLGVSMALWGFGGCPSAASGGNGGGGPGASTAPSVVQGQAVAYPSPARDQVSIAFNMPEAGGASLVIYDERGRSVGGEAKSFSAGASVWALALDAYSPGVYLYTLKLDLPSGAQHLGPFKFAVRP